MAKSYQHESHEEESADPGFVINSYNIQIEGLKRDMSDVEKDRDSLIKALTESQDKDEKRLLCNEIEERARQLADLNKQYEQKVNDYKQYLGKL